MSFGLALRKAREELGWTQPQLAHRMREASDGRVDLTPAEISRYERGRVASPRLEVLRAAAKATGKPIETFTRDGALDPQEAAPSGDTFRGGSGPHVRGRARTRRGTSSGTDATAAPPTGSTVVNEDAA